MANLLPNAAGNESVGNAVAVSSGLRDLKRIRNWVKARGGRFAKIATEGGIVAIDFSELQ
jgi:hypothetical protein